MEPIWYWVGFHLFIFGMLALDLGVLHRKAHEMTLKEASLWVAVWVTLAALFCLGIFLRRGSTPALEFLTGYLIEQALSVDNIFVFVLIFSYFRVPRKYQHRVLFWGILGALVMRGTMIAAGTYLIHKFHWVTYVFGAFLVITAIRMATHDIEDIEPESNPIIKLVRRFIPVTTVYDGQRFFVRQVNDRTGHVTVLATPLFIVLILLETTDLVFAVDSIPAIFAVTTDPFLVYTSNIFAILGLRSLYFLLSGVIELFHFLKVGLSVVLGFVGVKMLLADIYKIPIGISLGVIASILLISVLASLLWPRDRDQQSPIRREGPAAKIAKGEPLEPDDVARTG